MGSAIWSPTRCTGLSACIAPWNTTEASAQRTARTRPQVIAFTSSPSSSTRPPIFADLGSSRSTVPTSVLLPQPLSPAMPSDSPACTASDTPRTAGTSVPCDR